MSRRRSRPLPPEKASRHHSSSYFARKAPRLVEICRDAALQHPFPVESRSVHEREQAVKPEALATRRHNDPRRRVRRKSKRKGSLHSHEREREVVWIGVRDDDADARIRPWGPKGLSGICKKLRIQMVNVTRSKVDDLAVRVDDEEDAGFQANEPCDLVEITPERVAARKRSPTVGLVAEVQRRDRPKVQDAKCGLRPSSEAAGMVGVQAPDADEEVALYDFF